MIKFDLDDIKKEVAESAYYNTSMSPERRGEQVRKDYVAEMEYLNEHYGKFATEENKEELEADLLCYQKKYLDLIHTYLHSHASVASSFITGPSNFPVSRNQKRSEWQRLLNDNARVTVKLFLDQFYKNT